MKNKVWSLQSEKARLENELQQKDSILNRMKDENLRAKVLLNVIESYKNVNKTLQTDLATAQKSIQNYERQTQELNAALSAIRENESTYMNELQNAQRTIQDRNNQVTSLNAEVNNLRLQAAEVVAARTRIQTLEADLNAANDLVTASNDLIQERDNLHDQVVRFTNENTLLNQQATHLQNQVQTLLNEVANPGSIVNRILQLQLDDRLNILLHSFSNNRVDTTLDGRLQALRPFQPNEIVFISYGEIITRVAYQQIFPNRKYSLRRKKFYAYNNNMDYFSFDHMGDNSEMVLVSQTAAHNHIINADSVRVINHGLPNHVAGSSALIVLIATTPINPGEEINIRPGFDMRDSYFRDVPHV